MKFSWESVMMMTVLQLSVFVTHGDTCPGGISGHSGNDVVCCPLGCGQCGGIGCTYSGVDAGLGSESCCGSYIKSNGKLCSETGEAPCILGDTDDDVDTNDESTHEGGEYAKEFSGDGTYYTPTTEGNCAFFTSVPGMYDGMIPVALSASQYGNSEMCGACIEGEASGEGAGATPVPSTFKAYVSDQCPECHEGDLDFMLVGDGRWDISWKFVSCPGEDLSFVSPSANPWYLKVQPRGTKTPVKSLTINGQTADRTADNHFIRENTGEGWSGTQTLKITTVAGETETVDVSFSS
ncbi:unnamed protein product [Pylaiella littoralis]